MLHSYIHHLHNKEGLKHSKQSKELQLCNCCLSAPALWPWIKSFYRAEIVFTTHSGFDGAEGRYHTSVSHIQQSVFLTERSDIPGYLPAFRDDATDRWVTQSVQKSGKSFFNKYIWCCAARRVSLPLESGSHQIWGGTGCRACCLCLWGSGSCRCLWIGPPEVQKPQCQSMWLCKSHRFKSLKSAELPAFLQCRSNAAELLLEHVGQPDH